VLADYFEAQSSDPIGWYMGVENHGEVEVQNFYHIPQEIYLSPAATPVSPTGLRHPETAPFESVLPGTLHGLVRTYRTLLLWVVNQIVAPTLGLQKREARMEAVLQALEICRARSQRSMDNTPGGGSLAQQACIPSMVEAVFTAAILHPASRAYARAWTCVAAHRNVSCDSLASLLARSVTPQLTYPDMRLCPDLGWVFERMLEVLMMEDTIHNNGPASSLINLEKRRCVRASPVSCNR
jgi:hypothetical protein